MRWPWTDKHPKDGRADDQFGDTYMELALAWIAVCLTALVVFSALYYLSGGY